MKKMALVLFCLPFWAVIVLAAEVGKGECADSVKLVDYANSQYNITTKYPEGWIAKEGLMGTVVAFSSPLENEKDLACENVNIVVQDLPSSGFSLEQYTKLSLYQLKQLITNIKILTSKRTKLSGNDAYGVICTGMQGKYLLKWMVIWTVKNNKAYVITYTAEESKYNKYFKYVEKIVNNLHIY